jgi:hypothetical protein
MLARIHAAPNVESHARALQTIADALFALNLQWIGDARRGGLDPPPRVSDCAPPWCSRPIIYRPYHGDRPAARERDYFDGPTLFHRAEATCIDVAAYDAAAISILEDRFAMPFVEGDELAKLHCVVLLPRERGTLADARRVDPTAGLRSGETITRPWP